MIPLSIFGGITDAVFGNPVEDAFEAACQKLWNGIITLLSWSFKVMDKVASPDVNPTAGHPLGQVYPVMMWLGLTLALAFGFMSAGWFALSQGRNAGEMASGFVKFVMAWVGGLSLVALLVEFADLLTIGLLGTAKIDSWGAVGKDASWLSAATGRGVSPVLTVLIGVLFILPAAVGFLVFGVIRAGGIEVISATMPILAAGAMWTKTSHWLSRGLQWLLTLIWLPPALTLPILIGASIMAGVSGNGGLAALGQLLVGSVTLALGLAAPLLLMKLFAFVEPMAARFAGGGGFGFGRSSRDDSSGSAGEETGGMSPQDQVAEMNLLRAAQAAQAAGDSVTKAGKKSADTLDAVGVGHPGNGNDPSRGSTGGTKKSSDGESSDGLEGPAEQDLVAPSGEDVPPEEGPAEQPAAPSGEQPAAPSGEQPAPTPGAAPQDAGRAPVSSPPEVGEPAGGGQPGAGAGGGAAAGGAEAAAVAL